MKHLASDRAVALLPKTEPEPIPLDELFSRATSERSALDRLREAQREARRAPADSDASREANEIAKRLLAQLEWREVALVALVTEQVCECGKFHFLLEGEYVERVHIRDSTARWHQLKGSSQTVTLPKRVEYRTMRVRLCPSCLREHGYA